MGTKVVYTLTYERSLHGRKKSTAAIKKPPKPLHGRKAGYTRLPKGSRRDAWGQRDMSK